MEFVNTLYCSNCLTDASLFIGGAAGWAARCPECEGTLLTEFKNLNKEQQLKIEKTAEDVITVSGSIGDTLGGIFSIGAILFVYIFALFLGTFVCLILIGLFIIALPFLIVGVIGYGIYKLGQYILF